MIEAEPRAPVAVIPRPSPPPPVAVAWRSVDILRAAAIVAVKLLYAEDVVGDEVTTALNT